MSLVLYIAGGAVCATAGAGVCAMILNSRNRRREESRRLEAEALVEKIRTTAQQELAQLRSQSETAAVVERQELAAQERRLTERESLYNTQLTRVLQTENE